MRSSVSNTTQSTLYTLTNNSTNPLIFGIFTFILVNSCMLRLYPSKRTGHCCGRWLNICATACTDGSGNLYNLIHMS